MSASDREAQKALVSIANSIEKIRTNPAGDPSNLLLDPTPESTGEAGVMEKYMKEFANRMVTVRGRYQSRLEELGWNEMLLPSRLQADTGLKRSKKMLADARQYASDYRREALDSLTAARDEIGQLAMSSENRKAMLVGFDSTLEQGKALLEKNCDLEDDVLAQFGVIVQLLDDRARWTVDGSRILFQSDLDLATYNKALSVVGDLVRQQAQIQKDSLDEASLRLSGAKIAGER